MLKIGDVVKVNGCPVTVEGVGRRYLRVVWFEGAQVMRGRISRGWVALTGA